MSQPVVIRCPRCDRALNVREDQLGRAGQCTHCGQVIALELRLMPQVAADEATQLMPTPKPTPAPPAVRRLPPQVVIEESPILRRRTRPKSKKRLAPVKALILYWTVFGWPAMWLANYMWWVHTLNELKTPLKEANDFINVAILAGIRPSMVYAVGLAGLMVTWFATKELYE